MRIQLGSSTPALVMLDGGTRAKAKLQTLSLTGGLLRLAKALEEGDFVEVAFQTQSGPVHGMAEMLHPASRSNVEVLQPFRFVAIDDNEFHTLKLAVDAIADRDFLGLRSQGSARQ